MSFKIFLRDINVSNARNALYTLGSSSPRFPAESVPNSTNRYLDCDRSKSETRIASSFELSQPIKPSQRMKCMLAPKTLKHSPSSSTEFLLENSEKVQSAGNKIFMAAMLYSWRKQRHLIKELSQQLEDIKRRTLKHDNRIHVYEKMYDTERERSFDLKNKLRESQKELKALKTRHDTLAGSNAALKASISLLEQQLQIREEQYEGLQVAFTEMQTTLFRSMGKERELQRQLSDEQRRVQSYMVRENDLVEKIQEFKKCAEFKEKNLYDQMSFKQLSLMRYKQDNDTLFVSMNALLTKKQEINNIDSRIQNTMNDIIQIKNDVLCLREQLQNSWDNRMKRFWRTTSSLRRRIAEMILAVALCVLPSMPLPRTSSLMLFTLRSGYS